MYAPLIQDFNPHYEHLLLDNILVLSAACNTIQTDANIIKCVIQVIFIEIVKAIILLYLLVILY